MEGGSRVLWWHCAAHVGMLFSPAQIAFETLLRRLPNLRLSPAPDAVVWRDAWVMRGLKRLLVECKADVAARGV